MATSDIEHDAVNVASPCVRLCTLGDDDVCVGCYRSLDEIKLWTRLSNAEKRQVIELANGRRPGDRRV